MAIYSVSFVNFNDKKSAPFRLAIRSYRNDRYVVVDDRNTNDLTNHICIMDGDAYDFKHHLDEMDKSESAIIVICSQIDNENKKYIHIGKPVSMKIFFEALDMASKKTKIRMMNFSSLKK